MINRKFNFRKKKIIMTELQNAVKMVGGKITRLNYYPSHFGNIILHFQKGDKMYEYVVDRGDIYFNKKGVCDYSYLRVEDKASYQKLIEIIIATATQ